MFLEQFSYVALPEFTGQTETDVQNLLLANGRQKTLDHVREVSEECAQIAAQFGLAVEPCRAAGLLHDISAIIRPADMLRYAQSENMQLCEAERRYPFLLHQRLSGLIAHEHFGIKDSALLCAIQCHATLRADATAADMALFLADKLAWDQPGKPPYEAAVRLALHRSLETACLIFMEDTIASGRLLYPHTNWTLALRWLKDKIQ